MATTRSFQIILKQEQTNKLAYVNVLQVAASEAVYNFSANSTSIVLTPDYTTNQNIPTFANKTITITSTKVYANATTNPTYTSSISSTLATNLNVAISGATVTFSVKSVPTSNLEGTVTLKQSESNKTIIINVSIQVSEFTFTIFKSIWNFTSDLKTIEIPITSTFNGKPVDFSINTTALGSWIRGLSTTDTDADGINDAVTAVLTLNTTNNSREQIITLQQNG